MVDMGLVKDWVPLKLVLEEALGRKAGRAPSSGGPSQNKKRLLPLQAGGIRPSCHWCTCLWMR